MKKMASLIATNEPIPSTSRIPTMPSTSGRSSNDQPNEPSTSEDNTNEQEPAQKKQKCDQVVSLKSSGNVVNIT